MGQKTGGARLQEQSQGQRLPLTSTPAPKVNNKHDKNRLRAVNQFSTGFQLTEAGDKGRLGLMGAPVNGHWRETIVDDRCPRQPVRVLCPALPSRGLPHCPQGSPAAKTAAHVHSVPEPPREAAYCGVRVTQLLTSATLNSSGHSGVPAEDWVTNFPL